MYRMRVTNNNPKENRGNSSVLINIMMAINEEYTVPASVTIKSIRKSSINPVCIYVLYSELNKKSIRFLENLSTEKLQVKCVYINLPFFDSLPTRSYQTRETYYRLFGYLALPEDIDRIIWMDADVIVRGDLTEFYRFPLDKGYFAGYPDVLALNDKENFNVRLEMNEDSKYIQAGIMLFNLKQIRNEGTLAKEVMDFISTTKLDLAYNDQDVINALYSDNGKLITISEPYIYNQLALDIGFFDIKRKGIVCLHYAGSKPWERRYCRNRLVWWMYAGMFPGRKLNIFKNYLIDGVFRELYSRLLRYKLGRCLQQIIWKIRGIRNIKK